MVLNNEEIKSALKNKSISISEFRWESSNNNNNPEPIIQNFDVNSLRNGHKIRLHMGFLVRTLSEKKWIDPKTLYNRRDGIVDLRKCNNRQYSILPGESIIVYTNEVVTLNSEYFGIILSRVSLEERGLVISQSYIDPHWSGVLQLIITNNSEKKQLLKEHCEIANLIIVDMSPSAVTPSITRNEHYNVTWETINNNTSYPKWDDRKRSPIRKFLHFIHTNIIAFLSLGIVAIVGLIYYLFNIFSKFINI